MKRFFLGIDVGSASSKCAIMDHNAEIIEAIAIQHGTGTTGPERARAKVLEAARISIEDISCIVATGYGRYAEQCADLQKSEISCHAKGAHYLLPTVRTILDIGGQDVKAISIDQEGRVLDFFMNDKCAAGTGRFLEVMARVMETPLEDLGGLDLNSSHPEKVSSTCTVFAESEVISLLSKGAKKEDIIRGVHESIVSRSLGLLYRTNLEGDITLTGGVAQNSGVVRALEWALKRKVLLCEKPQLVGAIGAALFALEQGG